MILLASTVKRLAGFYMEVYMGALDGLYSTFMDAAQSALYNAAMELAYDIRDDMCKFYHSLIGKFYSDRPESRYYHRTGNLYASHSPYFNKSTESTIGGYRTYKIYAGVRVHSGKMHDYPVGGKRKKPISAEHLLFNYIYDAGGDGHTYHGGNWRGGYGVAAGFSIYDELIKHRDELVKGLKG